MKSVFIMIVCMVVAWVLVKLLGDWDNYLLLAMILSLIVIKEDRI